MAPARNRAWEACVFLLKLAACLATMYAVASYILPGTAARGVEVASDSGSAAVPGLLAGGASE